MLIIFNVLQNDLCLSIFIKNIRRILSNKFFVFKFKYIEVLVQDGDSRRILVNKSQGKNEGYRNYRRSINRFSIYSFKQSSDCDIVNGFILFIKSYWFLDGEI